MEDFDIFIRTLSTLQAEPPKPVPEEPPEDTVLKRLRKHKFYKAVIRCSTGNPVRRRVRVSRLSPNDIDTEPYTQGHVKRTEEDLIGTLKSLREEMHTLDEKNARRCIADRASFRKSFDKMGNCVQWLKHKPQRNNVEEKYLRKGLVNEMKDLFSGIKSVAGNKQAYDYLRKSAVPGDKFLSYETEGLHILDEYLLKNDEDLFELVNSLDPLNTGIIDCSKLTTALQKENVPLEAFQLLQGVTALKCSDGDTIDSKDFCERMQKFRMYKWNRILTNNQGHCDNLVKKLEDKKSWNIPIDPYKFDDFGTKRLRVTPRAPGPVPKVLKTLFKKPQVVQKPKIEPTLFVPRRMICYHGIDGFCSCCHRETKKPKRKFWPGMLDNVYPCYMPQDRKHPDNRHHPLFEIIRPETPIQKITRLPPFTRYTIYDDVKVI